MELIKDLPDGLRRDIKRYICLDLIKKVYIELYVFRVQKIQTLYLIVRIKFLVQMSQVPLFYDLDDIILDNICDRVRPVLYSKDEKVIHIVFF